MERRNVINIRVNSWKFLRGLRIAAVRTGDARRISVGSPYMPFVCLAVLLTLTLLPSCEKEHSRDSSSQPTAPESPKPTTARLNEDAVKEFGIRTAPLTKHLLIPTLTAPARVAFNAEAIAHVGAPVAGRVVDLQARLGDAVKKGDSLFIVESPDLGEAQSDYLQKRTGVTTATAAVEPAKSAYERGKSLYEQSQGIALAEVQKREAELKAAQAALTSAQAAVTSALNKLRLMGMDARSIEALTATGNLTPRYPVKAPIEGQIVQRDVTLGSLVAPDKDSLFTIADLSTLWVIADVPEAHLADIKPNAPARISLAAYPGQHEEGEVSFISPMLDAGTRSAQVRIVVKNPHGILRPNMFAQAQIETQVDPKPQPVLAVPSEAVQMIDGQSVVFVPLAKEKTHFERRDVKVGNPISGWTPILSGIMEGEPVVIEGAFIIKAQLAKPPEE